MPSIVVTANYNRSRRLPTIMIAPDTTDTTNTTIPTIPTTAVTVAAAAAGILPHRLALGVPERTILSDWLKQTAVRCRWVLVPNRGPKRAREGAHSVIRAQGDDRVFFGSRG